MPRLVSRADLSRLAGVSRMAITKACAKALAGACHGDRIDLDDEAVRKYLEKHGKADAAPTTPAEAKGKRPRKATPSRPPKPDENGYSSELADFTLHEIVQLYGTIRSYKDLLEANEKRERALKNHLDNEQRRGELIERELVQKHIVGLVDATNRRLLGDAAKTIASRLYAMARGGSAIEDGERAVREIIASQIAPTKRKVVKTLRETAKWTDG
jgi:hypothetical protein